MKLSFAFAKKNLPSLTKSAMKMSTKPTTRRTVSSSPEQWDAEHHADAPTQDSRLSEAWRGLDARKREILHAEREDGRE